MTVQQTAGGDLPYECRPDRELVVDTRRGDRAAALVLLERHQPNDLKAAIRLAYPGGRVSREDGAGVDALLDAWRTYTDLSHNELT